MKFRSVILRNLITSLVLLSVSFFWSGCAFTPKPVFLTGTPQTEESLPQNDVKVCLVVRDKRPEVIQNTKMCGIMRNSYMMPLSIAFVANKDRLDRIVAYHATESLEKAGYDVVVTYPELLDELSLEELKKPTGDKTEQKSARELDSKSQREETKRIKQSEKYEGVDIEDVNTTALLLEPWGEEGWTADADAVVEISIDKFTSDVLQAFAFVSVQGWSKFKVIAADPDSESRDVVWGKNVTGLGTSGPRPIISAESYNVAVNMSYWVIMNKLDTLFRSEEFNEALADTLSKSTQNEQ